MFDWNENKRHCKCYRASKILCNSNRSWRLCIFEEIRSNEFLGQIKCHLIIQLRSNQLAKMTIANANRNQCRLQAFYYLWDACFVLLQRAYLSINLKCKWMANECESVICVNIFFDCGMCSIFHCSGMCAGHFLNRIN